MNARSLVLIIMFSIGSIGALAQAHDFASLPVEEAKQFIEAPGSPAVKGEVVARVLASRRMDLAKLCFENNHTVLQTVEETAKLPNSEFKDHLVIVMLKSSSALWPPENPIMGSGILPSSLLREPFVSVIRKHLPDISLIDNPRLLFTQASRLRVAERLEEAIGLRVVAPPPRKADEPVAPSPGPAAPIVTEPTASKHSPRAIPSDRPIADAKPKSPNWLWPIAVIAVLVFAWLFFGLKRNGQ